MKRFLLTLVVLLVGTLVPVWVFAQGISDADVIVLNDSVPGIDVMINPVSGTSGAVILELDQASVTLMDSAENVIFQASDSKIKGLELRFAPNAEAHRLIVQRLAGATQAHVRVASLADLTDSGTGILTEESMVMTGQEKDLPLNSQSPSSSTSISILADEVGTVTVKFPGAPVTAQLVDNTTGTAVATLYGGQIDGFSVTLTGGVYDLALLNNDPSARTVANVSLVTATETDFSAQIASGEVATDSGTESGVEPVAASSSDGSCQAIVNVGSSSLRSGPGTGYSIMAYSFRGDVLTVGGLNPESTWLLVAIDGNTAAWMDSADALVNGNCNGLTVYDIPTRDAIAPQVIVDDFNNQGYYDDEGGSDDGGSHDGGGSD